MIKPVKRDLTCYRGQTFLQQIYYERHDAPWEGMIYQTVKAEIRPSENSTRLIKAFECSVYQDVSMVELYLSPTETARIQPGFYDWDIITTDENGNVIPWIKGKFIVTGRVTE